MPLISVSEFSESVPNNLEPVKVENNNLSLILFGYFLNYIFGFSMIIAYSLPLPRIIYRIVKEKETKVKEFMKLIKLMK